MPLLLPASIIFPQVRAGRRGRHSASYNKTDVSWRVLTLKYGTSESSPCAVVSGWCTSDLARLSSQDSHHLCPSFFLNATGMDIPLQNFPCDPSATRMLLRLLLPGVRSSGVLINLLSHIISANLQSWAVYFSDESLVFSNEIIIFKPGLYGIVLSTVYRYSKQYMQTDSCAFEYLAITLALKKIVPAVIHQVFGSTEVRKIHTWTWKVVAKYSACSIILSQQFHHVPSH